MTPDVLPLTGERTVPGVARENYWFRRHEAVYRAIVGRWPDSVVLEAGCGEGYGAGLLAAGGCRVVAVDHDATTVRHVAATYPGVDVLRGNLVTLALASSSVAAVVSLQVIEHLWEQPRFLHECRRVLRPGGELVLSTPNRLTFSPGGDTPLNPFHTRELAPGELTDLVTDAGFDVTVLGLRHGRRLAGLDDAHRGSIVDAQIRCSLTGGAWPAALLADVASVTADDFELTDHRLDSSLDLVAFAVARG